MVDEGVHGPPGIAPEVDDGARGGSILAASIGDPVRRRCRILAIRPPPRVGANRLDIVGGATIGVAENAPGFGDRDHPALGTAKIRMVFARQRPIRRPDHFRFGIPMDLQDLIRVVHIKTVANHTNPASGPCGSRTTDDGPAGPESSATTYIDGT